MLNANFFVCSSMNPLSILIQPDLSNFCLPCYFLFFFFFNCFYFYFLFLFFFYFIFLFIIIFFLLLFVRLFFNQFHVWCFASSIQSNYARVNWLPRWDICSSTNRDSRADFFHCAIHFIIPATCCLSATCSLLRADLGAIWRKNNN
jgi:hypothetical protein